VRSVSYSSILRGIANLAGQKYDELMREDSLMFFEFVNMRLRDGWEHDWWPEWMRVELRYLRDGLWAAGTYSSGAIVYYSPDETYYENTSGGDTVETPSSTATDWTAASNFARYIPFEQSGQTVIGRTKFYYSDDPYIYTQTQGYPVVETRNGVTVTSNKLNSVYLEFRERLTDLSGMTEYSATATYAVGDAVYFSGEAYTVIIATSAGESPTTNPEKYTQFEVPYILANYLKRAVFADWLGTGGGTDPQGRGAAYHEKRAYDALEEESYKLRAQSAQYGNYTIRTS